METCSTEVSAPAKRKPIGDERILSFSPRATGIVVYDLLEEEPPEDGVEQLPASERWKQPIRFLCVAHISPAREVSFRLPREQFGDEDRDRVTDYAKSASPAYKALQEKPVFCVPPIKED